MPTVKQLLYTNPAYDQDEWLDLWALYKGGKTFADRVQRFLLPNPLESPETFNVRCKEAHYRCYLGAIINYFAALLFSGGLTQTPKSKQGEPIEKAPEFYAEFALDCDGAEKNFLRYMHDQFVRAATQGASFTLIDLPQLEREPANQKDWEELGGGNFKLKAFTRAECLDWSLTDGVFDYLVFYRVEKKRPAPASDTLNEIHRWWVVDREKVELFEHVVDVSKERLDPEKQLTAKVTTPHDLGVVPVVCTAMPDGLWIGDLLRSPQVEHFRISSGQNWGIKRCCYAMPVFKIKDSATPPKLGAGYFITLGIDEDVTWISPPTDVFAITQQESAAIKDEIYRVVMQMAQGVSNNAAAVGRSGESKMADADATNAILTAYGAVVRESAGQILNMIAKLRRGDELQWSIGGMDTFQTIPPDALLALLKEAKLLDLGSQTFDTESRKRVASTILTGLEESTKKKIEEEIDASATQREEHAEDAYAAQKALLEEQARNPVGAKPVKPGAKPTPNGPAGRSKKPN